MIKYPKLIYLNILPLFIILLSMITFSSCGQSVNNNSNQDYEVQRTDTEWRAQLSAEEFNILRNKGTERAFSGKYVDWDHKGTFNCKACNNPLFSSETKFESGTGWPSFYDYYNENSIIEKTDNSHGWARIEIVCQKCGSHIGHVFEDGPKPTGLRYCMNSLALTFEAE